MRAKAKHIKRENLCDKDEEIKNRFDIIQNNEYEALLAQGDNKKKPLPNNPESEECITLDKNSINEVIKIGLLEPNLRTKDQIENLQVLLTGLNYFHKLDVKGDKAVVRRQCAKHLLIQVFDKDEVIIRKGDKAFGFFIMLEGNIMLNKVEEMNESLLTFDKESKNPKDDVKKKPFQCLTKLRAHKYSTPHQFFKNENKRVVEGQVVQVNYLDKKYEGYNDVSDNNYFHYENGKLKPYIKTKSMADKSKTLRKNCIELEKPKVCKTFLRITPHSLASESSSEDQMMSPLKSPKCDQTLKKKSLDEVSDKESNNGSASVFPFQGNINEISNKSLGKRNEDNSSNRIIDNKKELTAKINDDSFDERSYKLSNGYFKGNTKGNDNQINHANKTEAILHTSNQIIQNSSNNNKTKLNQNANLSKLCYRSLFSDENVSKNFFAKKNQGSRKVIETHASQQPISNFNKFTTEIFNENNKLGAKPEENMFFKAVKTQILGKYKFKVEEPKYAIPPEEEIFERIFVTSKEETFDHIPISGIGVSFGELGILNQKPRGATLIAKDKVICIHILSQDYITILAQVEKIQQDKKLKFIQNKVLNDSFSPTVCSYIAWEFSDGTYFKGTNIYDIDDSADTVYFIVEGKVRLTTTLNIDKETEVKHFKKTLSKSIKVDMLEIDKEDCFGLEEFQITKKRQYRATVISKKCSVYWTSYINIARILKEHPQLFAKIINPVNQRLKRAKERLQANYQVHNEKITIENFKGLQFEREFDVDNIDSKKLDMLKRSYKGIKPEKVTKKVAVKSLKKEADSLHNNTLTETFRKSMGLSQRENPLPSSLENFKGLPYISKEDTTNLDREIYTGQERRSAIKKGGLSFKALQSTQEIHQDFTESLIDASKIDTKNDKGFIRKIIENNFVDKSIDSYNTTHISKNQLHKTSTEDISEIQDQKKLLNNENKQHSLQDYNPTTDIKDHISCRPNMFTTSMLAMLSHKNALQAKSVKHPTKMNDKIFQGNFFIKNYQIKVLPFQRFKAFKQILLYHLRIFLKQLTMQNFIEVRQVRRLLITIVV